MPIYQYDWAAVIAEVKAIIKVLNIVFHTFGTVSSCFFSQEHDKDAYSCCGLNEYCCQNLKVTRDEDRKYKGNDKTGSKSLKATLGGG